MLNANVKRIICIGMISMVSLVTAGCDDDGDNHRKKRPPQHAHHDHHSDHRYDRNRKQPPPPPPPPPRYKDNVRDDKRPEKHPNEHKRPPARRSSMVGVYSALALNDVSVRKGTSYYVDIFEDESGELFLGLPNGKDYQISFDNGVGAVAGGTILEQDNGKFIYTDKKGGSWLIEKRE